MRIHRIGILALVVLAVLSSYFMAVHASDGHETSAVEEHGTPAPGDLQPRYARTPDMLTEEHLSFGEKSHGSLEQDWTIAEFEVMTGEEASRMELAEGSGVRDIIEEDLVYAERVVYHTHEKGLEVIIMEFPDIETAREVHSGLLRELTLLRFIPSNEFGYEGYAATVRSPNPETNGFRRGQFIVQVAGEEESSAYDVKMMCKVIDNDLKEIAQDEGIILEMDPFLRLDGRGLVVGSRLFKKQLIGLVAIGINFVIIGIVAFVVAVTFMWRRRKEREPTPEIEITSVKPRTERAKEFFAPVVNPPKEVKIVLGVLLFLGFILTVLVIDIAVQFFLNAGIAEHEPGSLANTLYSSLDRTVDINMDGITIRKTGFHLSKNLIVLTLSFVFLVMSGSGLVVVGIGILLLKRRGIIVSQKETLHEQKPKGYKKQGFDLFSRLKGKIRRPKR